ncbi:MAG: GTP pyrophosphokinase, partial [Christensenellaceae bacterium]|nr:GTP pyrophosphokinase [Christensenellaceae bacterium]
MNLDLFNYIEQTLEIYETKKNIYKLIAEEITEYFEDILVKDSGGELSIQYRIKSTESTREKIIRNNLAHIHDDPEDVLRNMRDLIGVRLECMFIQDEAKIYEKIRSIFTKT